MLRLLSIAALLVSSWACTVQLVNGRYTNTCGCSVSYSNGTNCSAVVTTLTTISSKPITVQNWPDADLVDAPQCYTRSYYNSLGASTSLFPVGTDSVLVDCDGDGNRTLLTSPLISDVCSTANEGWPCGSIYSGKTCQCTGRRRARNLLFGTLPGASCRCA